MKTETCSTVLVDEVLEGRKPTTVYLVLEEEAKRGVIYFETDK